ncbi:MAG TPA: hypothetical protein VM692_01525 [Gammaproteobacteria bacterium]|nr:hypothetical protein [Gammaproteobacteria bacterium]
MAGALVAAPCAGVRAQSADATPFNWAYAPALGAGVYRLGDGTEAQTYRGNFSLALRDAPASNEDRAGIRLLLPVALGVQNLDSEALPVDRPTNRVEHAGFLPGVELEHRVGARWTLRTRAQLGAAEELEGTEQSARLAAVGLRGRLAFDSAPGKPALIAGLLWAGFDPNVGERESLLRATTAVELDIRAARWRVRDSPMHWRPHVLKDWYYRSTPRLGFGDSDAEPLDEEWQVGIAAAREDGFKIGFAKFDAVGVAYRFSDRSRGLRLYLNSVF